MSRREKLIVALVSAFAIALGAGFALRTSQPPSQPDSASDAAPPTVNVPPKPENPEIDDANS